VSDLIDTTEMYLRTVYELQEEGIVPLRARIAERLAQSGPTVSQTVSRMERDGLLVVGPDRQIQLTELGELQAMRVMRKHRLVERLLLDVIGLDWQSVHDEACRWEHVVSDKVEQRLLVLLDQPTESPFGNPIPGLAELDPDLRAQPPRPTVPLHARPDGARATVARIAEALQEDPAAMAALHLAGVLPGARVQVANADGDQWRVGAHEPFAVLTREQAGCISVEA
jgi:DtxR family Mn-dependent transcriptional regulator